MADPLTGVGTASAVVDLVLFLSKVAKRVNDFQDLAKKIPHSLIDVEAQLGLLQKEPERHRRTAL